MASTPIYAMHTAIPPKPQNYSVLLTRMRFDPKKHLPLIKKAQTILARGQCIGDDIKAYVHKEYHTQISAVLRKHDVPEDIIQELWHEYDRIIATFQFVPQQDNQCALPQPLVERIERQLQKRGGNTKHIYMRSCKTTEGQTRMTLYSAQNQITELIELDPTEFQSYPIAGQDAIINHEIAHIEQRDMLLRILLDVLQESGTVNIPDSCRTEIFRLQELFADCLAADTLESARALRTLIVAWYRKYGRSYFFSLHKEHPTPYQRFCIINNLTLLHEAAEYLQTGSVPDAAALEHYQMRPDDYIRIAKPILYPVAAIGTGGGLGLLLTRTLRRWQHAYA